MTREQFLETLRRKSRNYNLAGVAHEWTHWVGGALAAICSAVAGLTIAADMASWGDPYGRIITSVLAIIPAVWAGLDRVVRFRQMSVFNYGVSVKLEALYNKVSGSMLDPQTRGWIDEYNEILFREHEDFNTMINGDSRYDGQNTKNEAARAVSEIQKAQGNAE